MNLYDLQTALAEVLLDPQQRLDFATDPTGYAAAHLPPSEARVLAAMDPTDLAYFGIRREFDRTWELRSDFPHTCNAIGNTGILHYLRNHPFAEPDPADEARRFATWIERQKDLGRIDGLTRDQARYEAASTRLWLRPDDPQGPSVRRAAGLAVVTLEHRIFDDPPAIGPLHLILQRHNGTMRTGTAGPVEAHILGRANGTQSLPAFVDQVAHATGHSTAEVWHTCQELAEASLLCLPK